MLFILESPTGYTKYNLLTMTFRFIRKTTEVHVNDVKHALTCVRKLIYKVRLTQNSTCYLITDDMKRIKNIGVLMCLQKTTANTF